MRLTEKKEGYIEELKTNGHIYFVDDILPNNCKLTGKSIDKLGQLEDIEAELGVDLITLFKALRDSIAIKNEDGTITVMWACPRFQISLDCETPWTSWILYGPLTEQKVLYIKDYGKTWALTKEELV